MKTITTKVIHRVNNTRTLIAELPPVFTKAQYDTLRKAQAEFLAEQSGEDWAYYSMLRNASAFSLTNLVDEGFAVIVHTESFPKEIQVEVWSNDSGFVKVTKTIEAKRYFYSFTDELENYFSKVLDNNSNL